MSAIITPRPLNKRTFLKSALAATAASSVNLLTTPSSQAQDNATGKSQYYELRVYTIQSPRQQQLLDEYWSKAAIPAYNRMGVQPVGVFIELDNPEANKVYVLIPFDSLEAFASAPSRLAADAEYQKAASDFMSVPMKDPAYVRFDSSLLVAFESMKKLEVPKAPKDQPWVFELRTYESHNEAKGINKVDMFNAGEVPIMKEVGLSPVFFAQSLVGGRLPNLIYMVSGESKEAHKAHFKAFSDAPGWKKLVADPNYRDNVSKINSVFLKRTAYSQI